MSKKEPPGRSLVTVVSTLPAQIAAQDKQQRTLATVVSKLPAELAAKDAALHGKTPSVGDPLDGDDAVIVAEEDDHDGERDSIDSLDVGDVTKAEPIAPAALDVLAAVGEHTGLVDVRKASPAAPRQSRKLVAALVIAALGGVSAAYMMTRETTKAKPSGQPTTSEKWIAHDAAVTTEESTDAAVASVTPSDAATPPATPTARVEPGVAPPRKPPTGANHRKPKKKNWDPNTLFPP